jgi:hypothetical protein
VTSRFSSVRTCELRKMIIPSEVNTASSVNIIRYGKWEWTACCYSSAWQKYIRC